MDNFDIIKSYLLDEGFANSEKTAIAMMTSMSETWKDEIVELYKGKHGQSEKEYMDSRSDAGKQISGDSKQSGAAYSHRSFKGQGKPAKPGERQTAQGRMTNADRTELMIRKNALRKEAEAKKTKKEEFESWVNELVEEGHDLSDYTWDEMYDIYEGYKEIDKKKETKMYRRAGNLARTALSSKGKKKEDAMNKSGKIVSAIARQKEDERFSKMADEKARDNYKEDYRPQLKLYMGQMDEETLNELGPLIGVLARVAGGAAARGIAAKGAGIAAKGALRKKAVELAARKGGEAVEDKINNIVRKKKE